ncbi:putative Ig domain-containing protein [Sorangium sp. So ce693]|uniref:putative Ig domain-containing protein n=1 Tax=Sorangium sp. So ce693 TaxID=3133318 RepID=UPI003F626C95
MQRPRAFLLLAGATLATTSALSGAARAQSSIDISMTEAPATPRLQGPFVYGAAPSSPFLFAIPATGRAPLEFSVSGLPAGLTLTSSTGIISGKTPAAGSYPVQVTVTNAAGTASATYTLQSGSTLALTPPMGWNSYDSFGASVTEQDMIEQAQAVRTYLQPYGWNTVVIDYRWYEPGQPIDANGRYVPAAGKYPSATGSNGFKSLADGIHAMGLGFGIHIMRGVPRKSYNANLPIAGSSYTTRDAGNPDDPCPWDEHMWGVRGDTPAGQAWYDALFQQYASWGVDFVKIDDMLNNSTRRYHQAEADAIHRAVEKTGRSIMLSFSPGPNDPSWLIASSGHLNSNANMWRVVNDFWDYNALTDLPGVLRAASTWQGVGDLTPGHWPDLDMLPLGYLGPRNEWHASGQTRFTKNEQVTIMSLWTMLPSPLMFGGNPARLGSDAWTLALLTNEEVLAVNQDALGARGRRTTVDGGEIWVRDLSGDRKAVAFFNHGDQDMTMSVSLSQLGVTGTPVIRDLWRRADVSGMSDALSADVPAGAALMYTLSPPGGMGEVSSAAATSGSSGGASTSEGGAGGGGGDTGGGGGAVTAGVSAGGAGSGGEAGAAGSTGEPSGCGCTVPGHRRAPAALLLLLATTALGALRRRAARRNDANVVCR